MLEAFSFIVAGEDHMHLRMKNQSKKSSRYTGAVASVAEAE